MNQNYRPDIDGLRAIAIMSVVVFHAFPSLFPGGFIGVDIFFVISGYLITKIILDGASNHTFNLTQFYKKRVKRLFPALLTVLTSCLVIGYFVLLADEYDRFAQHLVGAASFSSNFILWREAGYFDLSSDQKILLHLWSLAIEEQFYLIWPLLIWFLYIRKLNIGKIILFLVLSSLVWCVFHISINKVASFYSPLDRSWELMVGALLAEYSAKNMSQKEVFKSWASFLSGLGLVFIVAGFLIINHKSVFPGLLALLPTLGAGLILLSADSSWLGQKILAHPFLVFIGVISYPLYLWHWPLLVFLRLYFGPEIPYQFTILAIFFSFILAWLTYKFIELPLRRNRLSENLVSYCLCMVMIVLGVIGFFIKENNGLTWRYEHNLNERNIRIVENRMVVKDILDCSQIYKKLDSDAIRYSTCLETSAAPKIALLGDSHANHLLYGFANSSSNFLRNTLLVSTASCPPAIDFISEKWCSQALQVSLNKISKTPTLGYVVISAAKYSGNFQDSLLLQEGYEKTITKLLKMNLKVIFIVDPSGIAYDENGKTRDPEDCVRAQARNLFIKNSPEWCNGIPVGQYHHELYLSLISRLKDRFPRVIFYDSSDLFCPNEKCQIFDDNKLLVEDFNHLSKYGSEKIAKDISTRLVID